MTSLTRVGGGADEQGVIPPDDLPRSPTGRVPLWAQDEMAGREPADTTWRAPAPDRVGTGAPSSWNEATPMPDGWAPDPPSRLGRSGGRIFGTSRASRARRRPGRVIAALTAVLVLGGLWWSWSPDHRQTAADVLAQVWPGEGGPGSEPRWAADGSRLPPPGLGEAATRLVPVVSPVSTGGSYAFSMPGAEPDRPSGWSPCRPIHYVVDVTGAPHGFREAVRAAVAEVGANAGLVFLDDGEVIEAAVPDRLSYQPEVYGDRWAPVLIRFADATSVPGLAGSTVGLAGGQTLTSGVTGNTHFVSGTVYLDVDLLGRPMTVAGPAYLPVLRHELGHLVGLDHVDDPTQLMYPTRGSIHTYQAGDLTGLSLLGQVACAPDL